VSFEVKVETTYYASVRLPKWAGVAMRTGFGIINHPKARREQEEGDF